MSDAEEPSYYEIALTNSQVLIALTILLVCMMTSFFAGLWIGRGDGSASAGPPAAAVAQVDDGAETLPEFKFFSEPDGADGEAAPEPQVHEVDTRPARPSTLAEDVLGSEASPPAADAAPEIPPPPLTKPATAPAQPPAAEEDEDAPPPRSAPAPRAVAEEPAPQTQAPLPRTTVRRPPASGEELFIQVFSSRDEAQANKVLERLKGGGFAAFLSPVQVDDQTMYRVRVGPFTDRAAAEQVAQKVRQSQRLDTWITP